MERRRALTTAGAATLTLLAGAGAIAMGSGIVNGGPTDDVGNITPISTAIDPGYVDPSTGTIAPAPPVAASTAPPVTTSSASTVADGRSENQDGERDDDERYDDDEREHDEREHDDEEEREYEGADDDD